MGRGRLAKLGTTATFIGRRLFRPAKPAGADEAEIAASLEALGDGAARETALVQVAPTTEWVDTGLRCAAGDAVTLVAAGRVWLAERLGLGVGPKVALWHRIGDGPIGKSLGDTTSFTADREGPLQLAAKPPGEWLDSSGAFDPAQPPRAVTGGLTVGAVIWRTADGLQQAAASVGGPFRRELERQATWVEPPDGWRPLWRLGHGPIFRAGQVDGRPAICCRTHEDVGILQRAVDVPLDETTELRWSWRMTALPSDLPEDLEPTHDYLSIAAEFENGLDLTYMWSSRLRPETAFRCPLPWWCERETHLVVRQGTAELGRWREEARPLLADYRRAIGGEEPGRVVGVWLIAVSVFQGGTGACDFADISLARPGEALKLL